MKKMFEEGERPSLFSDKLRIILTISISIVVGIFLVASSLNLTGKAQQRLASTQVTQTIVTNGADRWDDDRMVTAPTAAFAPPAAQIDVSTLFKHYYQQVGVGDTAPNGLTVAMKDGWMPGPDGLWAMNTSGIVTAGNETYIISVYTQEQSSLAGGQALVRNVCSTVAGLLT